MVNLLFADGFTLLANLIAFDQQSALNTFISTMSGDRNFDELRKLISRCDEFGGKADSDCDVSHLQS